MLPPIRVALLLSLVACAADGNDGLGSETELSADPDGKADASAELQVRSGETTLAVSPVVARRGDTFVLRGRTSRTLISGRGFVSDDDYGTFTALSPRTFELSWPVSGARMLVDGHDQLVGLDFVHASQRPDSLTARVVVRPRLGGITGSSKIYLTAEVVPVVVGGSVTYRISGHSVGANTDVHAWIDGIELPSRRLDDARFQIDLDPAQAFALTAAGDLQLIVAFPTGGVEKHAKLGLAVKKLGLTEASPATRWPPPTCTTTLRSCLTALPDGALDLGPCGEAIAVLACAGSLGVTFDDGAFQAALHATDLQLGTPQARTDAVALVGSDRADGYLFGAKQTVESRLERLFASWYVTATARQTVVAAAIEGGLDAVTARPLDLVEPHAASPGNPDAERQVVADAVLAELARMDFVHSEFGRSLEALVHDNRASHITDIGLFRTTVAAEPAAIAGHDVYIGAWLGLHTEVEVVRATGVAVRTLVEID